MITQKGAVTFGKTEKDRKEIKKPQNKQNLVNETTIG